MDGLLNALYAAPYFKRLEEFQLRGDLFGDGDLAQLGAAAPAHLKRFGLEVSITCEAFFAIVQSGALGSVEVLRMIDYNFTAGAKLMEALDTTPILLQLRHLITSYGNGVRHIKLEHAMRWIAMSIDQTFMDTSPTWIDDHRSF